MLCLRRREDSPVQRPILGQIRPETKEVAGPDNLVWCFRNSIPTLMRQLGYNDKAIKAQGRWSSEALLSRAVRREEHAKKLKGVLRNIWSDQ